MFEKRYTPFYGPSQLPLRLRVHVEDGWFNGAWSVLILLIAGFGSSTIFSNAWLQWKSNPYWRKPCFWLDLCKTFGRTMKVMHSVWGHLKTFLSKSVLCVAAVTWAFFWGFSDLLSYDPKQWGKEIYAHDYAHFSSCGQRVKGELAQAACVCYSLKVDFLIGLQTGTQEVHVHGFMPPWTQAATMFPHQAAIEAGNSHNILTLLTGGMSQP